MITWEKRYVGFKGLRKVDGRRLGTRTTAVPLCRLGIWLSTGSHTGHSSFLGCARDRAGRIPRGKAWRETLQPSAGAIRYAVA